MEESMERFTNIARKILPSKKVSLIGLTMLMFFVALNAQTMNVRPGYSHLHNTFETIQEAINACPNGGTVKIFPGTYTGTGNRMIVWPQNRNITVEGFDDDYAVINTEGPIGFILNNVTDQNTIRYIKIQNSGLAIQLTNSYPIIEHVKIIGNNRGILINNSVNFGHEVQIRHCEFIENVISPYSENMGVSIVGTTGNLSVKNSIFKGNIADAVYDYLYQSYFGSPGASIDFTGSQIHIEGNLFEGNFGTYTGGNIMIRSSNSVTVVNNKFIDNYATRLSVILSSHDLQIVSSENVLIANNIFTDDIYFSHPPIGSTPSIILEGVGNVRYVNNTTFGKRPRAK